MKPATLRNPRELLSVLPFGHENALTTKQLARMMGWRRREITLAVQTLRRRGVVILSNPAPDGGYWLLDGSENDLSFARMSLQSLRGRIAEQVRTADALEKALAPFWA